jgi:hypothetical protein
MAASKNYGAFHVRDVAGCLRCADGLAHRASRFTDLDRHGDDAAANLGTNNHYRDGVTHGHHLAIAGYSYRAPDHQANSDAPGLISG